MLSNVLNSERAIAVSIQVIRVFNKLKQIALTHQELSKQLDELKSKYDEQFVVVFEAIKQLLETPEEPKNPIGFKL